MQSRSGLKDTDTFRRMITLAFIVLGLTTSVMADAVTYWNEKTALYAASGGRPGPSFVIDIAVVQAAVYDAVQAIEGDYQPYCGSIPGASGSVDAAVAKAARDVLVNRFPAQAGAIHADYVAYVAGIDPDDPGFDVGESAAQCMIALRANDGAFPAAFPPYTGGTDPGDWRPTPPANANMAAPWLGRVTPFTMRSGSQFSAQPPPKLSSPEYTRAYKEVKDYGSLNGSLRSVEQTELANFWNGNFPGQMNKLARDVAISQGISVSESSRLLALVDLSIADAAINCWADKVRYNFWRPVTGIRLGDDDDNGDTEGVADWTPFITTPPYPDYTSGANNLAAAGTRAISLFFDTNEMEFEITTTNPGPTTNDTRSYSKLSDVRAEVVNARIYQGIHFRFADTKARKQGEHIAQWAHSHFFRPVKEAFAPKEFSAEKLLFGSD